MKALKNQIDFDNGSAHSAPQSDISLRNALSVIGTIPTCSGKTTSPKLQSTAFCI